ncbi:MAG TPA: hypothetical protein VGS27_27125 [Candidatus Sulfotelmatobacter sp.]|nr:hypothetical protein [Candidatus Sulfotelmatobacter sp.]
MPPKQYRTYQAPENVEEKTTATGSARKTKNTPKTPKKIRSRVPRGQRKNSSSSSVSGYLTRQILQQTNGKLHEVIMSLYETLAGYFDMNNNDMAQLVDLMIADFWRMSEGIKH